MFKQYRKIEPGEFFVIGGDCSQGGKDKNACQFLSKTKLDIPLVYHLPGVAAQMTSDIYPVLEKIFDITGVKPMVCLERNNGGGSEMERLKVLNRHEKYDLFIMPQIGQTESDDTKKLGWVTSVASRPIMLGDWKNAFDSRVVRIYHEKTIKEHKVFVVNKQGKPEASKGKNDDLVFGCAIAWQLYQRCDAPEAIDVDTSEIPDDTTKFIGGQY